MIEDFAKLIPKSQRKRSGKAFYSGRRAFETQSNVYIIGINPGGSPDDHPDETVSTHTAQVLNGELENWSAYRDESWSGRVPGTAPLQQSLLQLIEGLNMDPGEVPASNLFFVRSSELKKIEGDEKVLAAQCWPFHQSVIYDLRVRVVVCFGKEASNFLRRHLNTYPHPDAKFINGHGWGSYTYRNARGQIVVALSHPSRGAHWTKPGYDPTDLVLNALD